MKNSFQWSIALFGLFTLLSLSGCGTGGGYSSGSSIYFGYGHPYYYYDDDCCYRPPHHRPDRPNRPERPDRPRPPSGGPSILPIDKGPSIQPVPKPSRPSIQPVRPRPSMNMGRPSRMQMSRPAPAFRGRR